MNERIGFIRESMNKDRARFKYLSQIYLMLMIVLIVTLIPLADFMGYLGLAIWGCIALLVIYVAMLIEKEKKKYKIQIYQEVLSFMKGKSMDETEMLRQEEKPYKKGLLAVSFGIIVILVSILMIKIIGV